MADIVERLRWLGHMNARPDIRDNANEAAAEIVTLRTQLAEAREALVEIAIHPDVHLHKGDPECHYAIASKIARATLERIKETE